MMSETHPDELDLLAYVDRDLRDERRQAVADHVGSCPVCASNVRALAAGRDAVRASPVLEFPAERRAQLAAALADSPRPRRLHVSPMRLAAFLAPVALAAAVVIGIASLDRVDGGGDGAGGGREAATVAPDDATGGGAEPGEEAQTTDEGTGESAGALRASGPLAQVRGPAPEVARALRARGFGARVVGGDVVVTVSGGRVARLVRFLETLPRGGVRVLAAE